MAPGPRPTALGAPYNEVLNPSVEQHANGWVFSTKDYPTYNADWEIRDLGRSNVWADRTRQALWSVRQHVINRGTDLVNTRPFLGSYVEIPAAEGDAFWVSADLKIGMAPRGFNSYFFPYDANGALIGAAAGTVSWQFTWTGAAGEVFSGSTPVTAYEGRIKGYMSYGGGDGMPPGTVKVRWYPICPQGKAGDEYDVFVDNLTAVRQARPVSTDTFATNTVGSYTFLAGTGTVAVAGGKMSPTSTAAKLFKHSTFGYSEHATKVVSKVIFGTTVANKEACPAVFIADANNFTYVGYESGNLRIWERIAGVDNQRATIALTTAPVASQTVWIVCKSWYDANAPGYKVIAEWWTTDPALGGAPQKTVTFLSTTGNSSTNPPGIYWPAPHSSLTSASDEYRVEAWDSTAQIANAAANPGVPMVGWYAGLGWEGAEEASRSGTGTAFKDPFDLYPRARAMLATLPPVFQEDPDVRGIIYAHARGVTKQEAQLDALLAELNPATATETGLPWFETLVQTAVKPPGRSVADRRATLVNRFSRVTGEPAGSGWETAVAEILGVRGSDWDYAEYVPGSLVRTNKLNNPGPYQVGFSGFASAWSGFHSDADYSSATLTPFLYYDAAIGDINGGGAMGQIALSSLADAGTTFTPMYYQNSLSGPFGALPNPSYWGIRAKVHIVSATNYGPLRLILAFMNGGTPVSTVTAWSSPADISSSVGAVFDIVGKIRTPLELGTINGMRFYFDTSVKASGPSEASIAFARLMLTKLVDPSEDVPAYFDGYTDGYWWQGSDPGTIQSATLSAGGTSQIDIYVPWITGDPSSANYWKELAVMELIPSHLVPNFLWPVPA